MVATTTTKNKYFFLKNVDGREQSGPDEEGRDTQGQQARQPGLSNQQECLLRNTQTLSLTGKVKKSSTEEARSAQMWGEKAASLETIRFKTSSKYKNEIDMENTQESENCITAPVKRE